jgi:hypothetical protein
MKSFFLLAIAAMSMLASYGQDQDKTKRPSPPAQLTATLSSGAVITIDYSQPSVKGRTIGKDLEPMEGKVWRTGANEATIFTNSKDVTVEGKPLPAGKYALFTLKNGDDWTIIFNKTANQWGAFKYKEEDDALRVKGKASKASQFAEKMAFAYDKGTISILWADSKVDFSVK